MKPFALKHLIPTESDEQASLFQWASHQRYQGRRLSDLMIAIPNGAVLAGDAKHRAIQMARLKRTGLKPGASDVFVTIPRPPLSGLWIEVKRRSLSIVSDDQREFIALMLAMGYGAEICFGWEEGRAAIEAYLGITQRTKL